jgi:hypothetical protein
MAINLTVDFLIPNGKRLVIERAHPNDAVSEFTLEVSLRTTAATNHVVSRKVLIVRNGLSDRLRRNPGLSADQPLEDLLLHDVRALSLPTGYTNAFTAWSASSTPQGRKNALETWCLSSGVFDSSLAGN